MMDKSQLLAAFLVAALLSAPAIHAQKPEQAPPRVVSDWIERLERANESLVSGQYKRARRIAERVLDEIVDRVTSGGGVEKLLAAAVFVQAVAEASLGGEENARRS